MSLAYLDVEDEITSAANRLRAPGDRDIALVLPAGSRLGTSRINFRLLAREAAALGRDLAIVSPEPATRSLAASAGLPSYATVVAYEDALAYGEEGDDAAGSPGAAATAAGLAGGGERAALAGGAAEAAGEAGARGGSIRAGSPIRGSSRSDADAPDRGGRPVPRDAGRATVGSDRHGGRRLFLVAALGLLVIGIALAAGAAAWLYLPSATVTVVVQPTDLPPLTMTVEADPTVAAPDPANGVVPAERRTFPLTASGTFAATGKKVTETKATGVVRWQNCDPTRSYVVPAATTLETKTRVAFTTDETVFLPVAILSGSPITIACQSRDVGITAAAPGTAGNVPAGTITTVPGIYNSVVVRVTNPTDTTGGTHTETTLVAQKDVDAAVKKLTAQLDAALATSLKDPSIVGGTATVFPKTGSRTTATPDQDPAALVGQAVPSFELGMTSTGSVIAVDTTLVSAVADQRLRESVPPGEELVAGSTSVQVGQGTVAGGRVTFPATAIARVVKRIDPAAVRDAVKGRSLEEARAAAAAFGEATVTAWPDWVSTIPTDDGRVTVDITYAGGATEPAGSPGASAGASGGSTGTNPGGSTANPGSESPTPSPSAS